MTISDGTTPRTATSSPRSADDILNAQTGMGAVTLRVSDLDLMTSYYNGGVGLDVISTGSGRTVLGREGEPSIILEHTPSLKHASSRQAGLYHTAILFGHESDLAASVYSVASKYPQAFTGSSDHLVSKALYFNDPEGNGVELYWDRPRDHWQWQDGKVVMGTEWLDPNRFLAENLTETGSTGAIAAQPSVGHVHLKVGDIPTAKAFYINTVGFETTFEMPTALFVSAGGYHHHLGMNTWESAGAGTRTPALGLGQVSIEVPTLDDLGALGERLQSAGVASSHDGATLSFDDPWSNQVRVRVAP